MNPLRHESTGLQLQTVAASIGQSHSLRFQSLFHEGRSLCFPCDAAGQVALQQMSERARNNYFFARACVGREFACPRVEPALH